MSIVGSVKASLKAYAVVWLVGVIPMAFTALVALAWPDALSRLAEAVTAAFTPLQLLAAAGVLVVVTLVLSVLLVSTWREQKLFPKYGVYWDKKGNAYCPRCKALSSQVKWGTYNNGQWHGLWCNCSPQAFVLLDNGKPLHFQDAMRLKSGA